jgi:peptide/nickel transport system substrate-binding protein
MAAAGKGQVVTAFATSVERILVNLTDPAVGQAMSMAIDRVLLTEIGYGQAGRPTCNLVPAPAIYASDNTDCLTQDIEGAKALLDEAGWVDSDGDGVREKDGVELSVLFTTSTNSVRQSYQSLIKQWWEEIGIETELRNVSASVFFGSDPASPDTLTKMYADVAMWTSSSSGTDPQAYLTRWICSDIPGPNNQWQGGNSPRFCSDEYDALVAEMARTAGIEERGRIAKQLNDILVQNQAMIPITYRGGVSAKSVTLGGVQMNDWSSELWNIADWYRID